ncbi:hypothetical protein GCM10010402_52330 [Actinomadura luteofluorescens]
MICGSAVDTTVLLSIATNSTSSRPLSASRIWRCDIGADLAGTCSVKERLRVKWAGVGWTSEGDEPLRVEWASR